VTAPSLRAALALFSVACAAPAPGSEVAAVDVVMSAAAAPEHTAAATATTVAVTVPSADSLPVDERRVLRVPPPPLLLPTGMRASLAPPSAGTLAQTNHAALAAALGQTISSSSPGMTADGASVGGTFKQGDTMHLAIVLQPGRCYTIVAVGKGISELDLELMIDPGPMGVALPPSMLARDTSSGSTAVIGSGGNCFKNPMPVPVGAVAVVRATTGAGTAVAQAFVK
jgi:hypothetical protein